MYSLIRFASALVLGWALGKADVTIHMWQFWVILAAFVVHGAAANLEGSK